VCACCKDCCGLDEAKAAVENDAVPDANIDDEEEDEVDEDEPENAEEDEKDTGGQRAEEEEAGGPKWEANVDWREAKCKN